MHQPPPMPDPVKPAASAPFPVLPQTLTALFARLSELALRERKPLLSVSLSAPVRLDLRAVPVGGVSYTLRVPVAAADAAEAPAPAPLRHDDELAWAEATFSLSTGINLTLRGDQLRRQRGGVLFTHAQERYFDTFTFLFDDGGTLKVEVPY